MIAGSNGMRQEQTEPSGNSISDGNKYSAPARKSNGAQRRTLGNIVFPVEKMLVSKVLRAFGNPPVEIVLWNGQKISKHNGSAVASVLFRDRGALFK
jgi:hypothetical protein